MKNQACKCNTEEEFCSLHPIWKGVEEAAEKKKQDCKATIHSGCLGDAHSECNMTYEHLKGVDQSEWFDDTFNESTLETFKCKQHNDSDCECFIDMGPSSHEREIQKAYQEGYEKAREKWEEKAWKYDELNK